MRRPLIGAHARQATRTRERAHQPPRQRAPVAPRHASARTARQRQPASWPPGSRQTADTAAPSQDGAPGTESDHPPPPLAARAASVAARAEDGHTLRNVPQRRGRKRHVGRRDVAQGTAQRPAHHPARQRDREGSGPATAARIWRRRAWAAQVPAAPSTTPPGDDGGTGAGGMDASTHMGATPNHPCASQQRVQRGPGACSLAAGKAPAQRRPMTMAVSHRRGRTPPPWQRCSAACQRRRPPCGGPRGGAAAVCRRPRCNASTERRPSRGQKGTRTRPKLFDSDPNLAELGLSSAEFAPKLAESRAKKWPRSSQAQTKCALEPGPILAKKSGAKFQPKNGLNLCQPRPQPPQIWPWPEIGQKTRSNSPGLAESHEEIAEVRPNSTQIAQI